MGQGLHTKMIQVTMSLDLTKWEIFQENYTRSIALPRIAWHFLCEHVQGNKSWLIPLPAAVLDSHGIIAIEYEN